MRYQDTFLVNADQSFKAEDWLTVGHKSRDGLPMFHQLLEQSSKKFLLTTPQQLTKTQDFF